MLISFIITTWLLAMLPGVGQALMLRQTLARGPQAAVATILGTSTGLLIWAVAAAAGLSAAVVADPTGGCPRSRRT
jgi:threonine/homoserine/homoserine lactone efflux protein